MAEIETAASIRLKRNARIGLRQFKAAAIPSVDYQNLEVLSSMKIAVVGAGITGLTAAYRLSQKGHQVVVFEKENYVGGLAAGFRPSSKGRPASGQEDESWYLENYFHHFFTSDEALANLATELGLADKLFFCRPKSSIYYDGRINQFDSPLSVLKFPHLSPAQRVWTGLVTAGLKLTDDWKKFERITAQEWLLRFYGRKAYEVLWRPLLKAKFDEYASGVSMAWFWARIKKRSAKLGYVEGGFQVLIDKLVEKIKANGGEIRLGCEVTDFDHFRPKDDQPLAENNRTQFDRTIFTTPIKSEKLRWIGALNLILVLKEQFLTDGTYWLNINDESFPFVAVVEHTNFVSLKHYGGNHILYVGGYYPQDHRYFKVGGEDLLQEFLPYLERINSSFSKFPISIDSKNRRLRTFRISKSLYAQPIIPTNYSKIIPSFKTSNPKVFRANMQMVYPWDRGVNYAIELGEKVADEVSKEN